MLKRFRKKLSEDNEGNAIFGTHPGDLGVVAVAFIITCCFIYMLFMPQNWSAIDRAMAPDAAKPADPVLKKGETEMIIYDHTQKK